MFLTTEDIAQDIVNAGFERALADQLAAQAKPAVWLETRAVDDETAIAPGATKLGGRPDLPPGVAWPVRAAYSDAAEKAQGYRKVAADPEGWPWAKPEQRERFRREWQEQAHRVETPQPLGFVAQINFADMWAAGPLDPDFPRRGVLSLFYDLNEMPWGLYSHERIGFAVLFHDADGPLTRLAPPAALPEEARLPPLAVTAHACMTPLPLNTAQYGTLGLSEEITGQLGDGWCWGDSDPFGPSAGGKTMNCHRVGGWPTPIEDDMQTRCALVHGGYRRGDAYKDPALDPLRATATDWLLLAQIGTDDEKSALSWEDDGQLYLWIRRADLIARRFGQAHLVLQCS